MKYNDIKDANKYATYYIIYQIVFNKDVVSSVSSMHLISDRSILRVLDSSNKNNTCKFSLRFFLYIINFKL